MSFESLRRIWVGEGRVEESDACCFLFRFLFLMFFLGFFLMFFLGFFFRLTLFFSDHLSATTTSTAYMSQTALFVVHRLCIHDISLSEHSLDGSQVRMVGSVDQADLAREVAFGCWIGEQVLLDDDLLAVV